MLTPPWNPSIRFPALTGGAYMDRVIPLCSGSPTCKTPRLHLPRVLMLSALCVVALGIPYIHDAKPDPGVGSWPVQPGITPSGLPAHKTGGRALCGGHAQ